MFVGWLLGMMSAYSNDLQVTGERAISGLSFAPGLSQSFWGRGVWERLP